jgi:hypothetical protein
VSQRDAARLLHTYASLVQAAEWSPTALLLLQRSRLLGVLLKHGCNQGEAWLRARACRQPCT